VEIGGAANRLHVRGSRRRSTATASGNACWWICSPGRRSKAKRSCLRQPTRCHLSRCRIGGCRTSSARSRSHFPAPRCRTRARREDLAARQYGTSAAEIAAACFEAGGGRAVCGEPATGSWFSVRTVLTSEGRGKGPTFRDYCLQSRPFETHPTLEIHPGVDGISFTVHPPIPSRSSHLRGDLAGLAVGNHAFGASTA